MRIKKSVADEKKCASLKATSPTSFVIHSTAAKLSKKSILAYKTKNYHGKAHAYIMEDP